MTMNLSFKIDDRLKVSKMASDAVAVGERLWYNGGILNIVLPPRDCESPEAWTKLESSLIMDTISPCPQDDKTPNFSIGGRVVWLGNVCSCDGPDGTFDYGDPYLYTSAQYLSGEIKKVTPQTIIVMVDACGWHKSYSDSPYQECLAPIEKPYETRIFKGSNIFIYTPPPQGDIQPPEKRESKTAHIPYSVYTLSDPRDNTVRYVGISKNVPSRYLQHCRCEGLNLEKNLWVQELIRLSILPTLTIIDTATGLKAARERERHWIDFYKQHSLLLNVDRNPDTEKGW
jgi:predicted GIY-YIG superfamily endonuclease